MPCKSAGEYMAISVWGEQLAGSRLQPAAGLPFKVDVRGLDGYLFLAPSLLHPKITAVSCSYSMLGRVQALPTPVRKVNWSARLSGASPSAQSLALNRRSLRKRNKLRGPRDILLYTFVRWMPDKL